jgi:pilus assembly protein CpaF
MYSPVYQKTIRHFLKPVQELLDDEAVSEIMINGAESIYCERGGKINPHAGRFASERALMAAIHNIAEFAGRPLQANQHSLDARLPTGERVHAIWPPASRNGICLTIRKFNHRTLSLEGLMAAGVLTPEAAAILSAAVKLKRNVLIAGGTGTGKTTILNALSEEIDESERIIVIEDSSELKLRQQHTLYLEAQSSRTGGASGLNIRDLFAESLRMRPDRIIVGEVRRGEALDLVQSMISGHAGALSTIHASSPQDAVSRLETLCMMGDGGLPIMVARNQVASAIHLVLQLCRAGGGRRYVSRVSECLGLDSDNRYCWNELFRDQHSLQNDGSSMWTLQPRSRRLGFFEEAEAAGLDGGLRALGYRSLAEQSD